MKHYFTILLTAFLFIGSAFAHKFYVGICQIDHNPNSQSLEITLKLFTDDLEYALEKQGAPKLFLGSEKEHSDSDQHIIRYIKKQFQLSLNGETRTPDYIGKESELDVLWLYLELSNVQDIKTLEVKNGLLTDFFEDQSNIMHLNIAGKKQSTILNKHRTLKRFEF